MAVEVAGTLLHWFQPPLPSGSSTSNKALAFAFSKNTPGPSIAHHRGHKSYFLGTAIIHRSHQRRAGERRSRARAHSSASLDGFGFVDDGKDDEDEFEKRINDFASKFKMDAESRMIQDAEISNSGGEFAPSSSPVSGPVCPSLLSIASEIRSMRPDLGPACDGFEPDKVQLRANSFDLPLSLRILKRKKKQWESAEMADSAYSPVKKAFSSMVFIVRELQSHTIRMREALFSSSKQQIQGILARVHDELHSSFVWLFQRIFSTTPTLMVYLMLLLANFTIFSITDYHANAKTPTPSISSTVQESRSPSSRLDSSAVKSFSVGRSAAVGRNGGGGGGKKDPPVAGAADDGRWDRSSSSFHSGGTISPEVASTASAKEEDDEKAWKRIVEEAEFIRASGRHEALMDPDTLRRFISPVTVELELDDLSAYAATELSYRRVLAEGLDDPLLLSNFAQFLYVVLRDHDRAEEYFKRAALAEPADPEALCRYANFLWVARKDLGAAEETFLEAIEADPANSYYSANYAHFLWSTGGEDTCYPPDACDS
ncbi:hypothetical protein KFK09_006492 [Dendrobium nobile]|uniref:Tetratricopeptide repeat-like superfamily protein n=1 Tax=Dendrobium nobile TaxID=94219 RepID=A0A8T3BPE2_DENNO|nr:hypothetical protein KFK09_006492 [Dendrobium nobile]